MIESFYSFGPFPPPARAYVIHHKCNICLDDKLLVLEKDWKITDLGIKIDAIMHN